MFSTWLLYTKCMITFVGLVHRNEFVVSTWNYQMLVWHVTVCARKWHCYLSLWNTADRHHVFIGLVNVFTLYTRSLYWLIHDNCIVDTLPDAYFACYRLAHDDGKCTNCMLQFLHRNDIDCFRFEFRFFSFRVHCQFEFLSVSTYLLHLWSW